MAEPAPDGCAPDCHSETSDARAAAATAADGECSSRSETASASSSSERVPPVVSAASAAIASSAATSAASAWTGVGVRWGARAGAGGRRMARLLPQLLARDGLHARALVGRRSLEEAFALEIEGERALVAAQRVEQRRDAR